MTRVLALATLLALVSVARAQDAQAGEERELVLAAAGFALEGRGSAQAFDHVVRHSGRLHVWASSSELDPYVRVERADGSLFDEDEDTGGGTTAWITGLVTAGEHLVVTVSGEQPGELGRVAVSVRELPETDATRAAALRATSAVAEARSATAMGQSERARGILSRALDDLLAADGVLASVEGHRALEAFLPPLFAVGDFPSALRVAEALHGATRYFYPAGCQPAYNARRSLAGTLFQNGRVDEALVLQREIVREVDLAFLSTRDNEIRRGIDELSLGQTYHAHLERETAAEWLSRGLQRLTAVLSPDDPLLVDARAAYAAALQELGEHERARALLEEAAAASLALRGPNHDQTLTHQNNLAAVLSTLGDKEAALDLHERVLVGRIATYGPDHPWTATSYMNVGVCLYYLGETDEAESALREAERVLERAGSTGRELADVRHRLALVAIQRGDLDVGREALRRAREVELTPASEWRIAIAESMLEDAAGDPRAALSCAERALAVIEDLGEEIGQVEVLVQTALVAQRADARERARELALRGARELRAHFERAGSTLAAREVEAAASARAALLSDLLALLLPRDGEPAREMHEAAFALVESVRGVAGTALAHANRARHASNAAALEETRNELRRSAREVARLARGGDAVELRRAVDARERAERELRELGGGESAPAAGPSGRAAEPPALSAAIAAALPRDGCALAFWRYDPAGAGAPRERSARLLAFVVGPAATVQRVELGSCARVRAAVEAWRALAASGAGATADGERASGAELERLLLAPLRDAVGDARHWFVAQDDALHALPLDALPDTLRPGELLGDRVRVSVVAALSDFARAPRSAPERPLLVALGGVDYAELAPSRGAESGAALGEQRDLSAALRAGSLAAGFAPLEATASEARAVAALFEQRFGDAGEVALLESDRATKAALERALEGASFAHIATHGFFAASDGEIARARDRAASGVLDLDVAEPRQGFTALARCGLALAGANRRAGPGAELEGVITAEELSALDLSRCELVVLSACDTGAGYLRAGQGVSSFQKALHAAGAQYVLASLWKVGDLHAHELMLELYRGLWELGLEPEEALWRAKQALRARRVAARDWAGWVLSRCGGG